jgi:hypothetical protein
MCAAGERCEVADHCGVVGFDRYRPFIHFDVSALSNLKPETRSASGFTVFR